ncbi:MAG: hypothetical protein ACJAYU_004314, partial [Bradymonadia bacterium]
MPVNDEEDAAGPRRAIQVDFKLVDRIVNP